MNIASSRIFILVLSVFSTSVMAVNQSADTIPFVTYKKRIIYYSPSMTSTSSPSTSSSLFPPLQATFNSTQIMAGSLVNPGIKATNSFSTTTVGVVAVSDSEASTSNIPIADMQKLMQQVRGAVCNTIGDSDVRVWFSMDASGKLLGVGASAESGLEVTFHCKQSKQTKS